MRTFCTLVSVAFALLVLAAGAHAETRVAVLYFDNHTSDASFDALGKGLADMLITDLGAVPGLTIVERSRLEALLTEQKLQKSKLSDPTTAVKVGKLAGAKYVVTGALTAIDPELRVDMRLVEIQTAKVIISEKVIGKKAEFFALEQELVRRFAGALQAKVPAVAAASLDVQAALAYGQGLDLADKGDLQGASKKLGDTVAKAPDFKLAQTRYADLLARLYAARDKRDTALSGAAKALADKTDQVVKANPSGLKGAALGRWFGYRFLRGNIFIKAIASNLGGDEDDFGPRPIPPAKQAAVKGLIGDWLANADALVAAMVDARKRGEDHAYEITGVSIDDDDAAKADALQLGINPHMMSFGEPQTMWRAIGSILCMGKTPFHADLEVHFTPTPWELDPAWQKRAVDAYEKALADIDKHVTMYKEREAMRTYDAWGECLVARGKKIEGIQRWQTALEKYPTSDEYNDIEQKVRDALQK